MGKQIVYEPKRGVRSDFVTVEGETFRAGQPVEVEDAETYKALLEREDFKFREPTADEKKAAAGDRS